MDSHSHVHTTEIGSQEAFPDSPFRKPLNTIDLNFSDLSYRVKIKNPDRKKGGPKFIEKQILSNLSGMAKHGELLAIMGPSGAGKTSLLNILSCRIQASKNSKIEGTIAANKLKFTSAEFSKFAGYVMQSDVLFQTLTPRESFQFAANLKIKGSKKEREDLVNRVLNDLNLTKAADTLIGGNLLKGISGGERKRTSIGVEIIADPSLLFLDEPTSGLDSFTAFIIIRLLKHYAQSGKTIVFTIHQPSSDIFFLFDRLMLLADGKFLYQGDTKKAVEYFAALGYECPEFSNPADYMMEIAGRDETSKERLPILFEAFNEKLSEGIKEELTNTETSEITFVTSANNWLHETNELSKRSYKTFFRNPILFRGRVVQTLAIAFVVCSIYFRLSNDPNNPNAAYNRNGALFFLAVSQLMMSMSGVVLTFPSEREVFLRETGGNLYGVSAYFFGRSSTELPFLTLVPFIFSCIVYWIIGFNNANPGKFFIFAVFLILQSLFGNAVGLLAGSAFGNANVAMAAVPLFLLPLVIFGGFYLNSGSMHGYVSWIQWISPFRYTFEGLVWNEYTDSPLGESTIHFLKFHLGIWQCVLILLSLGLFIRVMALICLKLLMKRMQ